MRLDEIIDALPSVGLRLLYLGEHTGADRWGCTVAPEDNTARAVFPGQGMTPVEALASALKFAGVELTDE